MTSTLCQSAALGRIIAAWVMKVTELFAIIVKTILSRARIPAKWNRFAEKDSRQINMLERIIDRHPFRSLRSGGINVIENIRLACDRTENRHPLFLITRPAKVFAPVDTETEGLIRPASFLCADAEGNVMGVEEPEGTLKESEPPPCRHVK
jgi:hypothetical protein